MITLKPVTCQERGTELFYKKKFLWFRLTKKEHLFCAGYPTTDWDL